jgi:DNA (cytosine-5)-methyltransferase 1
VSEGCRIGPIRPRGYRHVPGVLSTDCGRLECGKQIHNQSPLLVFRKATRPHFKDDAERWEETDTAQTLNGWEERHDPPPHLVAFSSKDHGADVGEISPTLRAMPHDGSHANAGGQIAVAYGIRSDAARAGEAKTPSADAEGKVRLRDPGFNVYEEHAPTLDAGSPHAVAFNARQDPDSCDERAGPVDTDGCTQAVAFHENQRAEVTVNDTAGSLKVGGGKPGQGYPTVAEGMVVRRLTPMECERLMGQPDGATLIEYRSKPAADGPRYKALGNSKVVDVVYWIGARIARLTEGK